MVIYTIPGLGWWDAVRKTTLDEGAKVNASMGGGFWVKYIYRKFFVFYCETYTKYIQRKVLSIMFHLPPSSTSINFNEDSISPIELEKRLLQITRYIADDQPIIKIKD